MHWIFIFPTLPIKEGKSTMRGSHFDLGWTPVWKGPWSCNIENKYSTLSKQLLYIHIVKVFARDRFLTSYVPILISLHNELYCEGADEVFLLTKFMGYLRWLYYWQNAFVTFSKITPSIITIQYFSLALSLSKSFCRFSKPNFSSVGYLPKNISIGLSESMFSEIGQKGQVQFFWLGLIAGTLNFLLPLITVQIYLGCGSIHDPTTNSHLCTQ